MAHPQPERSQRSLLAGPLIGPVAVGLLAFVLCVAQDWVQPTVPQIQDEFSYLLAADTFASGRLTNPPHPLRRHFDVPHVLQVPTYQSKYQPAKAMLMALAQRATGKPLLGIWLGFALACGAATWMMGAWLPARWALLGGLLAATSGTWLRSWAASYMGAPLAMAGGALLYGALVRGIREPRVKWGVTMGVGLLILALTRPFEGLIASLPAAVVLFGTLVRPGDLSRRDLTRGLIVPITVLLVAGAAWLTYYNQRVTGHPLRLPYQLYLSQHESDIFVHPKADIMSEERMAKIRKPLPTRFLRQVEANVNGLWILALPIVLAIPALWRRRWSRLALLTSLFTLLGAALTFGSMPHYSAPIAALILGLLVESLGLLVNHLRRWRLGVPLLILFLAVWAAQSAFYVTGGIAMVRNGERFSLRAIPPAEPIPPISDDARYADRERWRDYTAAGATVRQRHIERMTRDGGRHLVFVRYLDGSTRHRDWGYNDADIDASPIVWARWIPGEPLWPFLALYGDRTFWTVEPEVDPWTLIPFDQAEIPIWFLRVHETARARMDSARDPHGPVRIDIAAPGEKIWNVQIERGLAALEAGRSYSGSFVARATEPRPIRLRVGQGHPPWRELGFSSVFKIDETPRRYDFSFTATRSEPIPRLLFEFGRFAGSVELSEVRTTVDSQN